MDKAFLAMKKSVKQTIRYKNSALSFLCFAITCFIGFSVIIAPKDVHACCWACAEDDCDEAEDFIEEAHEDIRERTKGEFDDDLVQFHDWLIYMLETQFAPATGALLAQMAAVSMSYTETVGGFLDAQIQMDTQRLLRKMQFDAHKSYRPSEGFCTFGTNVRALAATESIGDYNSLALSRIALNRQLGQVNISGADGIKQDYRSRWDQFVDTYCDVGDNNRQSSRTGLELACDHDGPGGSGDDGAEDYNRFNRDIDYTRLVGEPRTLYVDFADDALETDIQPLEAAIGVGGTVGSITTEVKEPADEEDVIAMSKNLYGHSVPTRFLSRNALKSTAGQKLYLALRSIAAKRSVAQSSFNAIVGMKSSGTSHEQDFEPYVHPGNLFGMDTLIANGFLGEKRVGRFMASIVKELLPMSTPAATNIFDIIGYSPSYFSQLEVLAKRIYQNPDFYADLYDTPDNVARKKVAMQAIELMVDRATYESQLRREMIVSVLLSSRLRAAQRNAEEGLITALEK